MPANPKTTAAVVCHRHIAGEMGGTTEWYVRLPDGVLLVVGSGYMAREKADAVAAALRQSYVDPSDSPSPF
jgi:hypothetical protein